MKKVILLLLLIIVFAALLRLVGLEKYSPPLNRDEAGIGYNAYSLILTGKDEHGIPWPLSFKSIGDYKMPGYIYLSTIPVKILGLSIAATRMWSALGGVFAVIGIYFISYELSKRLGFKKELALVQALIPAALLTINPWHLHYSRLGFEANVNLTLFIWSVWFGLKSLNDMRYGIGAAFLLVCMQFMYSSTFIFLPLFAGGIAVFMLTHKQKSQLFLKPTIFIAFAIFILGSSFALRGVSRVSAAKSSITVFSDPYYVDTFNIKRGELQSSNPLLAKIIYNKVSYYIPILVRQYVQHFSPGFLFFNAIHHPWHRIYGQGFFYWMDGIAFLAGLYFLIRLFRTGKKTPVLFIFWWLLVSPVASAVTVDAPHATRSLYLLPVFMLVTGYGLWFLGEKLLQVLPYSKTYVAMIILSLYAVSFLKSAYQYVAINPYHQDPALFGGVRDVVMYAESIKGDRLVYMPEVASSAYIYHLFFNKVDPREVFNAMWKGMDTAGLTHIESLGQWRFVSNITPMNEKVVVINRIAGGDQAGYRLVKEFKNPQTGIIDWGVYEN